MDAIRIQTLHKRLDQKCAKIRKRVNTVSTSDIEIPQFDSMLYIPIVFFSVVHIIKLTGLPTPLNDVPQGRHFFIRRYFMSEVKPHLSYEGQIEKPQLTRHDSTN